MIDKCDDDSHDNDWINHIYIINNISLSEKNNESKFSQLVCDTIKKKIYFLLFVEFEKIFPNSANKVKNISFDDILNDIHEFVKNMSHSYENKSYDEYYKIIMFSRLYYLATHEFNIDIKIEK